MFHGQGTGEFAAYAADTGRALWSVQTGSAINAVPVSFKFQGEQYVIVPVGWGGAFRLWSPSTMMVTPTSKYGPSRLLAFKLGGLQPFPLPKSQIPEVPRPPEQTFTTAQVKSGEALADSHSCTDCHSPKFDGAGRWSKFWNVTLPGIKPVLLFMVLVGVIGGFQLFEIPWVLFPTSSGPNRSASTIVAYLFTTGFQTGDLGLASAIGWILVVIILSVTLLMYLLGVKEKRR